jgi:NAD(P)-dependent dehydrogenase (short-subunit alcohol dehydrogenase family)
MNKVTLVTGASSGIGKATAWQLLEDGYTVYAAARRVDRLKELEARGSRTLELDVTQDDSVQIAVAHIKCEAGRLDVLVNNAGYGSYGALEDVPLEEAKRQFEVNVFGLARLTQLVLPLMRQQQSGKIVNVSSIGGKIYEPLGGWYHATKFAVEGLSDSLRLELKPFGIDVIIIEPGPIKTEWGSIATDTLLEMSGQTVYASAAKERASVLAFANEDGVASPPEVVAKVISKALKARRPKTRYPVGTGAQALVTLRKIASDRVMDWAMEIMAKQAVSRYKK